MMRLLYENSRGGVYKGLGLIATTVANPAGDAVVQGADFHYLSRVGTWKFDGQLLRSDLAEEGEGYGGFVDVEYVPRPGLKYTLSTSHFDDRLDIIGIVEAGPGEFGAVSGVAAELQGIFEVGRCLFCSAQGLR